MMNDLRTILLAEDSSQDVELMLEALADFHLANKVVVVRDGVEAIDYLRCEGAYSSRKTGLPAVLLLDIKMPRMDGLEVLETIRKDGRLHRLPVVMLTSSREEPDLQKCYALGANAYVVKPMDFKDFLEAVKQVGIFWAVINEVPSHTER